MPKKAKLSLDELRVQSFVTSLTNKIKGGNTVLCPTNFNCTIDQSCECASLNRTDCSDCPGCPHGGGRKPGPLNPATP